jgi:PqqD family protein of HPr-rel-A system
MPLTQEATDRRLVRADGGLLWAAWDDEWSVYCYLTGETHLIGELPAEVLRQIDEAPTSLERLTENLAAKCERSSDPDWKDKIAEIVGELCRLELLRRVP